MSTTVLFVVPPLWIESLSREQHMLEIKTGGQDSCNVYGVLPCGIWIRISCSFCCYCSLKINPHTQYRKDKYEQLQRSMHKDLQRNSRSKDHNINLLKYDFIKNWFIVCMQQKTENFIEGNRNTKSWKGKKATSSSKYNYPLTSAIKSVSDKHDSVPWTGSNE